METKKTNMFTTNDMASISNSPDSPNSMLIVAGGSVGPFQLGMSIGAALTAAARYEETPELLIDADQPFVTDTVIELQKLGFRLCFNGYTQKLHIIIISFPYKLEDLNNITCEDHSIVREVLTFTIKNSILVRSSTNDTPPSIRHIYRICGPTIPGHFTQEPLLPLLPYVATKSLEPQDSTTSEYNEKKDSSLCLVPYYYLKYPGITFRFPIPIEDYNVLKVSIDEGDDDVIPFDLPVSSKKGLLSSPCMDRLFVYPIDTTLTRNLGNQACPWVQGLDHGVSSLDNKNSSNITTKNQQRGCSVRALLRKGIQLPNGSGVFFGSALQEVYQELGPPDKVTLKDLDVVEVMRDNPAFRLFINEDKFETFSTLGFLSHFSSSGGNQSTAATDDYFCNYFHRGLDLLICGHTHRVKKMVLHANFPGHPLFGTYSRCFFSIILEQEGEVDISKTQEIYIDTDWNTIREIMGPGSPPLLVDESTIKPGSPPGVRKFYGYPEAPKKVIIHCRNYEK